MPKFRERKGLRVRERSRWPGAKYHLGEEPASALLATTTAKERLAMMWPLARDAWALMGRSLPRYTRERAPGRIARAGDSPLE